MKKIVLYCALIFCVLKASAGKDVGNGGDAVVCKDSSGKIIKAELYDYYEARAKRKFIIDLGAPGISYEDKINTLLRRIERLNPRRAEKYKNWWASFAQESIFLSNISLIDIPDTGSGFVPADCEIQQLVVQQEPLFPGDYRYTINADIWGLLDNDSKAGLVLHELILREATDDVNQQANSINARYFNELLATKDLEKYSLKQYIELMSLIGFRRAQINNGMEVDVTFLEFYNNDAVKSAWPVKDAPFTLTYAGRTWPAFSYDRYSNYTLDLNPPHLFDVNGDLRSGRVYFKTPTEWEYLGQTINLGPVEAIGYIQEKHASLLVLNGIIVRFSGYIQNFKLPSFKGNISDLGYCHSWGTRTCVSVINDGTAQVKVNNKWEPVYALGSNLESVVYSFDPNKPDLIREGRD